MRLLIADDHALFRDGLKTLLEASGHEVVGEAANGDEAVRLTHECRPDVVLMDLAMPGSGGLAALEALAASLPDVKVVVLTAFDDDEDLFTAIKLGAAGYLLKDGDSDEFFRLLEGVERGEPAVTPKLASRLLKDFSRQGKLSSTGDLDALTPREEQVLQLLTDGVTTNRALAETLGISENTVKFHVRNILDKLRLHNRAEAVAHTLKERAAREPHSLRASQPTDKDEES